MQGFVLTAEIELRAPGNMAAIRKEIAAGLRGVKVPVTLKTPTQSELNATMKPLEMVAKQVEKTGKLADDMGTKLANALRRIGTYTIGATLFYKVFREIQDATKEAVEFQNELVKLRQVTGQSASNIQNITNEITKLSTSLGVSSRKLVDVAVTFAQAGLSAKDTQKALAAIAKTDVSPTFDNMKNTAEAAIAIMSQFKIKANDLEDALSAVNTVSAKYAVESSDLAAAFRRTGGAFQAAGGNINELMALFTAVRSTTRESAETIATAFKTISARLQRTDVQKFFHDLGVELAYTSTEAKELGKNQGNFVGVYESIRRISAGLKDIDSTDPRFAQVMKEIGGDRHLSKVIPMIKEFAKAEEALGVALSSSDSLTKDATLSQESLSRQITKTREELMAFLHTITDSQAFKFLTTQVLGLANALIKLADSLLPLLPALGILIGTSAVRGARPFMHKFVGKLKEGVPNIRGFASGGRVPGSGDGDTVPAMLTPGEFVLNKKAVKRIGLDNLQRVNAQKFAAGGLVGAAKSAFSGEGGIPNFFMLASVVGTLISTFGGLDSIALKVITILGQVVAQFGILRVVLNGTVKGGSSPVTSIAFNKAGNIKERDIQKKIIAASETRLADTEKKIAQETQLYNDRIAQHKEDSKNYRTALMRQGEVNTAKTAAGFAGISDKDLIEGRKNSLNQFNLAKTEVAETSKALKELKNNPPGAEKFKDKIDPITMRGIEIQAMKSSGYRPGLELKAQQSVKRYQDLSATTTKEIQAEKEKKRIAEENIKIALSGAGAKTEEIDAQKKIIEQSRKVQDAQESYIKGNENAIKSIDKALPDLAKRQNAAYEYKKANPNATNADIYRATNFAMTGPHYADVLGRKKYLEQQTRRLRHQKLLEKEVETGAQSKISDLTKNIPGLEYWNKKVASADSNLANLTTQQQGYQARSDKMNNLLANVQNTKGKFQSDKDILVNQEAARLAGLAGGSTQSVKQVILQARLKNARKKLVSSGRDVKASQGVYDLISQPGYDEASINGTINSFTGNLNNTKKDLLGRKNSIAKLSFYKDSLQQALSGAQWMKRGLTQKIKGIRIPTQRVINGAAGFAAVGTVAGGAMSGISEDNLTKLRNGTGGSSSEAKMMGAAGGALSYGASGATLGMMVGSLAGPIGTAVGGAVGGIAGAIYGWTTEASRIQNAIEQIHFDEQFSNLTTALQSIASGDAKGMSQIGNVRSGVASYLNQLQTVGDTDRRVDLAAQGKELAGGLPAFFNSIASSVDSLEQFKKVVGQDTIDVFNMLNKQSMTQFDASMKKQIDLMHKKLTIDEKLIKAQKELTYRVTLQSNVTGAVADAALGVSNDGIGGTISALRRSSNVSNIDLFSTKVKSLGAIFGDAGDFMANDAVSIAQVSKTLPGILTNIASRDPLGTGNNFETSLQESLGNTPKFIADAIIAQFGKMRGESETDADIIKDINTDVNSVVNQLTSSLSGLTNIFAEAAETFKPVFDRFTSGMSEVPGRSMNVKGLQSGLFDIMATRSRFNSAARGDLHADFDTLSALAAGKITNMGGSIDPTVLGNNLQASDARAFSLQKMIEGGNTSQDVVNELAAARTESERYAEALKMVASTSNDMISVEQERLNVLTQQRQKTANWNERFLGSSDTERMSMVEVARVAKAVSSGASSFGDVRSDLRGGVLSFLKDFDENKFNQLTGNVPSKEETAQAQKIDALMENSTKAQVALEAFATNDLVRFVTDLNTTFSKFTLDLHNNILSAMTEADTQREDLKRLEAGKQHDIKAEMSRLSALSGGLDFNSVQANFDTIKNLNKYSGINRSSFDQILANYKDTSYETGGTAKLDGFLNVIQDELDYLKREGVFSDDELATLGNNLKSNAGQFKDWTGTYRWGRLDAAIAEKLEQKKFDMDSAAKNADKFRSTSGLTGSQVQQIFQNQVEIARILANINNANPQRKAAGGFVGGSGNGDTVPAMLTPGEFVVRKDIAQRFGPMLTSLNAGRFKMMAKGGPVGGSFNGGSLDSSMMLFGSNIEKLSKALAVFPSEITLVATHNVNVNINGAQAFQSMVPGIKTMIVGEVTKAINKFAKIKFPEIGSVADTDLFNTGSSIAGVSFQG